ncbi:MAG: carboxylate-amine ligase [Alphaproteobacteria bacterium]
MAEQPLTVGMEEEYLLVDLETRDLAVDPPAEMMQACEALVDPEMGSVSPEFLRAQIEVGTTVCQNIGEARVKLAGLRRAVADAAAQFGLAPIAASTHPFAAWTEQRHTDHDRYNDLARDLQSVARRLLTCGMHVHVGFDDDELRIDLMSQIAYFLPHLLALSTSSPFWRGNNSGLMSYRISVFDELPRTGLPERFDSFGEFRRHVDILVNAGLIEDSSKIWWDIRPHHLYPTLEMRIADVCTNVDDGICVAALLQSILSALVGLRRRNQRWRIYSNMLIDENRWRAQRYGFSQGLLDLGRGEVVPYEDLLDEILEIVDEEARALGCHDEVNHAREILARGSSAHSQLAVYEAALGKGAAEHDALCAVVDWLIEETVRGTAPG